MLQSTIHWKWALKQKKQNKNNQIYLQNWKSQLNKYNFIITCFLPSNSQVCDCKKKTSNWCLSWIANAHVHPPTCTEPSEGIESPDRLVVLPDAARFPGVPYWQDPFSKSQETPNDQVNVDMDVMHATNSCVEGSETTTRQRTDCAG